MKKLIFFYLLILFTSSYSIAQNSNEITWFGLDFSKAKMVGSAGFSNPAEIQSYYLNEWNSIIIKELKKYDISKFYVKPTVKVFLDKAKENNNKVIASSLVTDNTHTITQADVQSVVKQYKGKGGSGEGLLFVVESFDKSRERAVVYVVLFDISSGTIKKMEKKEGAPSGFGFRNYWLGAIYQIMKKGL